MQLIDLPADYFDHSVGVTLTDDEVKDAVQAWLRTKGMMTVLSTIYRMAEDDTVFTIKPPQKT
jgi:hypothetical protein